MQQVHTFDFHKDIQMFFLVLSYKSHDRTKSLQELKVRVDIENRLEVYWRETDLFIEQ